MRMGDSGQRGGGERGEKGRLGGALRQWNAGERVLKGVCFDTIRNES
jgi:hypothetical protein